MLAVLASHRVSSLTASGVSGREGDCNFVQILAKVMMALREEA